MDDGEEHGYYYNFIIDDMMWYGDHDRHFPSSKSISFPIYPCGT